MANVKHNAAAQETCRRLIDAAGEVFAERGLHAATIKEITDRAGANMAAVHYHFRDKIELYAAVIRHALSLTPVASTAERQAGCAEDRLRAHIANLINDLHAPSRPMWCATLLAREFSQPTAALDAVMEELIRPRADSMNRIVRDILGPRAADEQVVRASLSIGAQCFLYLYQRELVRRLHPHLLRDKDSAELVAHILEFSLAGLRAMRIRLMSSGREGARKGRTGRSVGRSCSR